MKQNREPKTNWQVSLPLSLVDEIRRLADDEDRTLASVTERLLRSGLEQHRNSQPITQHVMDIMRAPGRAL